jgi:DNA-binding NarL/FixJ family response regulator
MKFWIGDIQYESLSETALDRILTGLKRQDVAVLKGFTRGCSLKQIAGERGINIRNLTRLTREIYHRLHWDLPPAQNLRIPLILFFARMVPSILLDKEAWTNLSFHRQRIVELVLQNKSNKEIGQLLGVSQLTVRDHLRLIYVRLGVSNRVELVIWYIANFRD